MIRWLSILLIVAGLLVAAVTVPIGGRTLWQRFQAPTDQANVDPDPAVDSPVLPAQPGGDKAPTGDRPLAKSPVVKDADQHPDLHTDEDRKALDNLIDRKLKADP